jgi:hypothetical protein
MPTSHPAETLLLDGPDAEAFAHAQFSSKVNSLADNQWQFSAWLAPNGRVRAFFHLARLAGDRYLLLLRGGSATMMVHELQRFVFRSRLNLTASPARTLATGPALSMHAIVHDAETLSFGCDTHSLIVTTGTGDDAWRLPQLRAGWPWLPSGLLNELLPGALSLQRLHAVAVDKGCYPGQEIVARLHFRGGHKRHLHSVTLSQAINANDVLRHDDRDVGRVLDIVATDEGIDALVVLDDDLVTSADKDRPYTLDNDIVMHLITSWPT